VPGELSPEQIRPLNRSTEAGVAARASSPAGSGGVPPPVDGTRAGTVLEPAAGGRLRHEVYCEAESFAG
jgi:hypothetical protein